MEIKISDHVFLQKRTPVAVVGKDEKDGRYIVEREGESFNQIKTIGFKNGLDPAEKKKLIEVMKEVKDLEKPLDKIKLIDKQLESIEPLKQNLKIKRYLESEKAYIMNTHGVTPRSYKIEEGLISS